MKVTYQSAKVTVKRALSGVTELVYTGVLTQAAFDVLRTATISETTDDAALLIRTDKALVTFLMVPTIPISAFRRSKAPAAIVVQPENYEMWVAYGRYLSAHGVMRAVFLPNELAQSRAWIESAICVGSA